MTYPNQKIAATQIWMVFNGTRWCILNAECQSGKTGTYNELIKLMLQEQVKHAYILCGSSDCGLRTQCRMDAIEAGNGDSTILFRQDLQKILEGNKSCPDFQNSLIIIDEAHLDQGLNQIMAKFLRKIGITADGNPAPLQALNIYVLTVGATNYAEIAALKTEETPYTKGVVQLKPGDGYVGTGDYFMAKKVKPTFNITPDNFQQLLELYPQKYCLMRFHGGKKGQQEEKKVRRICETMGIPVLEYTANKTEITITRHEQTKYSEMYIKLPCLEDEPEITTVILIAGRLRAGQVVPKWHVGFVWEGAANSKTDAIVQGLPGRMNGYTSKGAGRADIYIPPSALKQDERKQISCSEIERSFHNPNDMIPTKATNIGKAQVAAYTNGRNQCCPIRLEIPAHSQAFSFNEEYKPEYSRGEDRTDIAQSCLDLLRSSQSIQSNTHLTSDQKEEILQRLKTTSSSDIHIRNMHGDSQVSYFKNIYSAFCEGKVPTEQMSGAPYINFCITYKDFTAPNSNSKYIFVILYTDSSIPLTIQPGAIPHTNKKSHYSIHIPQSDGILIAAGACGFPEITNPYDLESNLYSYLHQWTHSELVYAPYIKGVNSKWTLSKQDFNFTSFKKNEVEVICARLNEIFGIKIKVKYFRTLSSSTKFNIECIHW